MGGGLGPLPTACSLQLIRRGWNRGSRGGNHQPQVTQWEESTACRWKWSLSRAQLTHWAGDCLSVPWLPSAEKGHHHLALSLQGCAEDVMTPLGSWLAQGLGVEATANVTIIATVLVVAIVVLAVWANAA